MLRKTHEFIFECFIYLPLFALYLLRLKAVDILMRSLDEAESQVRKNESRLSEEDIVPADTTAIKILRDQLRVRNKTGRSAAQREKNAVRLVIPLVSVSIFSFFSRSGRVSSPSRRTSFRLCSRR